MVEGKLKVGDIIENGFVNENHPYRRSVYIGASPNKNHSRYDILKCECIVDNQIKTISYYKDDIYKDPEFKVIGHIKNYKKAFVNFYNNLLESNLYKE